MSDGRQGSEPGGVGDGGLQGSEPGDGPGTGLDGAAGGREIGLDDGDARETEPIITIKMCIFVIKNRLKHHILPSILRSKVFSELILRSL